MKPWKAGTYTTEGVRAATHEAQAFLLGRAAELRGEGREPALADQFEYYAGAITAYVELLENGQTAHRASIRALETALAAVSREIAS